MTAESEDRSPSELGSTTIVINLAGAHYDADRVIVEEELKKIPRIVGELKNIGSLDSDVAVRIGMDAHELVIQLKNRLLQDNPKLQWVVLLDEYPEELEGGIREPLGWYSSDARGSRLSDVIETELEKNLDSKQRNSLELLQKQLKTGHAEPVPIVALVMGAINKNSQAWIKTPGPFHELVGYPDHEQRRWLTVKVLRHEIGHHVFPLKLTKEEREKNLDYNLDYKITDNVPEGEFNNPTMRAEAGANWFSWLIGSSEERGTLEKFTQEQGGPYRAYKELVAWAEDPVGTQPHQLTAGYWLITHIAYEQIDPPGFMQKLLESSRDEDFLNAFNALLKNPRPKFIHSDSNFTAWADSRLAMLAIEQVLDAHNNQGTKG